MAGLQKVTAKLVRSCSLVILHQYEPEWGHLLPHTSSSLLPCNITHCQSSSVTMDFAMSVSFWVCYWSSNKMEGQTGLSQLHPLHLNNSPEQHLWHQEDKTADWTFIRGDQLSLYQQVPLMFGEVLANYFMGHPLGLLFITLCRNEKERVTDFLHTLRFLLCISFCFRLSAVLHIPSSEIIISTLFKYKQRLERPNEKEVQTMGKTKQNK